MDFDDIIYAIGQFGRYQKIQYTLLCLPAISTALQNMMSVFILAQPEHRCVLPGYDNDTFVVQSPIHEEKIRLTIPLEEDGLYSKCHLYEPFTGDPNSTLPLDNSPFSNGSHGNWSQTSCQHWVYDQTTFHSSIITELDLVCERRWSKSHAQMFYMLGSLCGCMFLGPPADFFGRKKMMMVAILLSLISAFAISFTPVFVYLCVFFFINGGSNAAIYATTFVLGIELVGPQHRMYAGFLIAAFYGIGVILLAFVAYFLRDWQPLMLVLAACSVPFISYFWIIPESALWLISQGRYKEAEVILKRAAHVNKRRLPQEALEEWRESDKQIKEPKVPLWRICRYPKLVVRMLIIYFNWAVCSMTYYGLSLNVGDLAGDIYVNSVLYGAAEIVSYLACIPLVEKLGRRTLHFCCMFLAGIFCTVAPFPALYLGADYQWLTVTFAMIGKFGVSGAYAVVWLYTSELLPTVIRSSGLCSSSLAACIGGVLSPYIANLSETVDGKVGVILPLVVFGAAALAAGLLSLFLPETRNRKLPDTLDEANSYSREAIKKTGTWKTVNEKKLKEMSKLMKQDSTKC